MAMLKTEPLALRLNQSDCPEDLTAHLVRVIVPSSYSF